MRCLGQLTGLGLVLLFVVLFPCSMWTFNTQSIALKGDTYKDLFSDEGFYQELIPVVLPSLIEGLDEDQLPPGEISLKVAVDHLDYRDWEEIAPNLVTADWVRTEVEGNMDNFFNWLEGDLNDLELVFHTEVLRRRMLGQPGQTAVREIANALPICTAQEEQRFEAFVNGSQVEFPYCRPQQDKHRAELVDMLTRAKDRVASELPNELDLLEKMSSSTHQPNAAPGQHLPTKTYSRAELNEFRAWVRLWQRLLILVFLVPAAILSLIVIFSVRSAKSFFRWMGWPLLIGGLFTLIPLFFLPFMSPSVRAQSQTELQQGFATGRELVAEIIGNGMMRLIIGEFTEPILIQSTILVAIGFFGLVLSVLVRDPDALPETYMLAYPQPAYQTPTPMPTPARMPEMPTRLDTTPPAEQTPTPDRTPPPKV